MGLGFSNHKWVPGPGLGRGAGLRCDVGPCQSPALNTNQEDPAKTPVKINHSNQMWRRGNLASRSNGRDQEDFRISVESNVFPGSFPVQCRPHQPNAAEYSCGRSAGATSAYESTSGTVWRCAVDRRKVCLPSPPST